MWDYCLIFQIFQTFDSSILIWFISIMICGVSNLVNVLSEAVVAANCLTYWPSDCKRFCLSANNIFLTTGLCINSVYLRNSYNNWNKIILIRWLIKKNCYVTCLVLFETPASCSFNFSPTLCSAGCNKYSNCFTAVFQEASEYGPHCKIFKSKKNQLNISFFTWRFMGTIKRFEHLWSS